MSQYAHPLIGKCENIAFASIAKHPAIFSCYKGTKIRRLRRSSITLRSLVPLPNGGQLNRTFSRYRDKFLETTS